MSIQDEFDRLSTVVGGIATSKTEIFAALTAQGVTVPVDAMLEDAPAMIATLQPGGAPVIGSVTIAERTIFEGDTLPTIVVDMAEPGLPVAEITTGWRNSLDEVVTPSAAGVYTPFATASNGIATDTLDGLTLTILEVTAAEDLKAEVEALAATAGRTSVVTLKVVGVDTLPAGVSVAGDVITMSGSSAILEDWDLTGYRIVPENGGQIIRQCKLGEESAPVDGLLYYINIGPLADDLLIERNDFIGFDGVGGAGTMINQQFSGTQAAPTCAANVIIRDNLFRYADGDYLKVFGANCRVQSNYFDEVACYPVGTAPWASDTVYVVDATGLNPLGCALNSNGFLFLARNTGTLPSPPLSKTTTADWTAVDPHTDIITVRAAVGDDFVILNNLFADMTTARSPGLTQQIRVVRNTGTPTPTNQVRIIGNVFGGWGGFYPFAASGIREFIASRTYGEEEFAALGDVRYESIQAGNTGNDPATEPTWWEQVFDTAYEGPIVFQHNWMSAGKTGSYYAPTEMNGALVLWGDNFDLVSDAEVAAPNYAINTMTTRPTFGQAGNSPTLPSFGPFAAFDIIPTEYGSLQVGDTKLNAVAVHVHGQLAAYWEEGETPVVLTDRDFTLTDQGGGIWRLQNGEAAEVVVTVSTGAATVVEIDQLPKTVVFGIMGMSTMEYMLNPGDVYGQITDPADIPATPNVTIWTDTTSTGAGNPVQTEVTAAAVAAGDINPTVANWSVFWNRVAPGVYFHVVDLAVPGTNRPSLMDDDHADDRWPAFTAMLAAVRAEGLEFDAIIDNWGGGGDAAAMKTFPEEFSPFYMGQRWGGQAFTLGVPNPDSTRYTTTPVDNCLWDIEAAASAKGRGVFARNDTKLYFCGWNTMAGAPLDPVPELWNSSTRLDGGILRGAIGDMSALDRPARDRLEDFLADSRVATFAGHYVGSSHVANMEGSNHPSRTDPDGQILMSAGIAITALKIAGLDVYDPEMTGVSIPTGGAYADITVSLPNGGDLTTIRALESRAAPAFEPPHYQPVMGFEIRRAGDDDNERRPVFKTTETDYPEAYRGTVAITNAGSGTPRTGTIRITPTVPFAEGDRIEFDRGDASLILLRPRDVEAKIYLNQPIESVAAWRNGSATYPFAGTPVRPQPQPLIIGAGVGSGVAPSNTVLPAISGLVAVGETLTATNGTWTGDATITYARVWRRDGATIPSATGTTYDTVAADVGKNITVAVTATNDTGSATAVSAPVGPITGEDSGGTDFFTVGPTGPYFVDPSQVPASTTRIEYEFVIRLAAAPVAGSVLVASQSSTGADVQISSINDGCWRLVVEDGDGTKMISGASVFSTILEESGGVAGQWFKGYVDMDFGAGTGGEAKIYVNDVLTDTIPFIATASPANFQSDRTLAFLANTGGTSPIAGNSVGSVDVEYIEAWFTTSGVRTLRKRVAGDAATVNADPWKAGADAT